MQGGRRFSPLHYKMKREKEREHGGEKDEEKRFRGKGKVVFEGKQHDSNSTPFATMT